MPKSVRVRGIYSTALLFLLRSFGFQITDPSAVQVERFNLEKVKDPPDVQIYDRRDLQGVIADGDVDSLRTLKEALSSELKDAVFNFFPYSIEGIYRGVISRSSDGGNSLLVDLGGVYGRLKTAELKERRIGSDVTVQVLRNSYLTDSPLLTTKLKVPGDHALLIRGGEVKVSGKISDPTERKRLLELGKELVREGWGITWRSSAEGESQENLIDEVEDLFKEAKRLLQDCEAPRMLREGFHRISVEFPRLSKNILDELRSKVTQTIKGHHYYKACGGYVSAAVDMAENLLAKGMARENVESTFKSVVSHVFPHTGSKVKIEHVKTDGKTLNLGVAEVEVLEERFRLFRLKRSIQGRGVYDGLGVTKEEGDYAITETGFGSWILKTSYFSREGMFKGAYININTPVEVYPRSIRYVDLEVDVCLEADGEVKVVDEELLEKKFESGLITGFLMEKAKEILKSILDDLRESLKEKSPQETFFLLPIERFIGEESNIL
ncbi:DUF402 domain-containing protein [Candidatus Bathyarchaeota archaeon]|nr:DUF402 domain-containing protein [Candidatus Bathyarchaeota archaeon]